MGGSHVSNALKKTELMGSGKRKHLEKNVIIFLLLKLSLIIK